MSVRYQSGTAAAPAEAERTLAQASWSPRPSLNVARGGLADATLGTTTYAIGGFSSGFAADLDSVEARDLATGEWRLVAPMHHRRGNPAAVAAGGQIHVFGGFVEDDTLDVVEIFDPTTGRWHMGRPLPSVRGGPGTASVGDRIYVVGGFGAEGAASGTVDVYDTRLDAWSSGRPMPTRRGLLKLAQLGGRLYAIGGVDDSGTFQSKVEQYDPGANTWRTVAPMRAARGNPGALVFGNRILVVGGADRSGALRTSEVYDPEADEWQALDALLPVGRASLSAVHLVSTPQDEPEVIAFGGFEGALSKATATRRVEALPIRALLAS